MDYCIKNDFLKMLNDSMSVDQRGTKLYADVEQLKHVVAVLLHFKYQLVFIRKNVASLDFSVVAPEFEEDIDYCQQLFKKLIESCIFNDFIRKKEQLYDLSPEYCSFKRQFGLLDGLDGTDLLSGSNNSGPSSALKHLSDSLVETIISEPSHQDLSLGHHRQQQQPSTTAQSQPQNSLNDEFSSNDTSQSSFNHLMIQEHSQRTFTLGTGGDVMAPNGTSMADESSKQMYANLLDLIPKSNVAQLSKCQKDMIDAQQQQQHQPSTSGAQKRQNRQMSPYKPSTSGTTVANMEPVKKITAFVDPAMSEDGESFHMDNELLQVEYWCQYEGCRFKSKSLTQVKAHEERRHVKQIVKCKEDGCSSYFDTKDDLNEHMSDIHAGPLFKCALDVCSREFQSDYRLKQHIREEHKDEYLTCKVCTKKFKTRKYLTRHFRNVHPKEKITDEVATTLSSIDLKGVPMSCTIDNCDQKFLKRSKLKQHIKEEHKEEYLTCNFCDKVCKNRNNLTNHIWIMHEEGDFRCTFDDCDFASKFRKNLLNHKKLRHQRVRKCPMNDCGEMVPITRYQRHMSSLHKIKNYACSWPDCGKSFADHNALKNHVRIHLNFKRYKCKWPECGYASEQRFTVITHIRVCHFKLPRTKKKQLEMNISQDSLQNPYDFLEVCREDICI